MLFMTNVGEFQYLGIFSNFEETSDIFSNPQDSDTVQQFLRKPEDKKELASLFGRLFVTVNVFNLLVSLFLFNRIIAFLGVRNTTLIQPIIYLITFSFLRINNGYEAALFGFFAYQGIQTSIDYNNANFILNAVPSEIN
jgi:ATP/ADP translocase